MTKIWLKAVCLVTAGVFLSSSLAYPLAPPSPFQKGSKGSLVGAAKAKYARVVSKVRIPKPAFGDSGNDADWLIVQARQALVSVNADEASRLIKQAFALFRDADPDDAARPNQGMARVGQYEVALWVVEQLLRLHLSRGTGDLELSKLHRLLVNKINQEDHGKLKKALRADWPVVVEGASPVKLPLPDGLKLARLELSLDLRKQAAALNRGRITGEEAGRVKAAVAQRLGELLGWDSTRRALYLKSDLAADRDARVKAFKQKAGLDQFRRLAAFVLAVRDFPDEVTVIEDGEGQAAVLTASDLAELLLRSQEEEFSAAHQKRLEAFGAEGSRAARLDPLYLELTDVTKKKLAPPLAQAAVDRLRFLAEEGLEDEASLKEAVHAYAAVLRFLEKENLPGDLLSKAGVEPILSALKDALVRGGRIDPLLELAELSLPGHPAQFEKDVLAAGRSFELEDRGALTFRLYRRAYDLVHELAQRHRSLIPLRDRWALQLANATWKLLAQRAQGRQWALAREEIRGVQRVLARVNQPLIFWNERLERADRFLADAEKLEKQLEQIKVWTQFEVFDFAVGLADSLIVSSEKPASFPEDGTERALVEKIEALQQSVLLNLARALRTEEGIQAVRHEIRTAGDDLSEEALDALLGQKGKDAGLTARLVYFALGFSEVDAARGKDFSRDVAKRLVFLRQAALTGGRMKTVAKILDRAAVAISSEDPSKGEELQSLAVEWATLQNKLLGLNDLSESLKALPFRNRIETIGRVHELALRRAAFLIHQALERPERAAFSAGFGSGGTAVKRRNLVKRAEVLSRLLQEVGVKELKAYLAGKAETPEKIHSILMETVGVDAPIRPLTAQRIVREAVRRFSRLDSPPAGLIGKYGIISTPAFDEAAGRLTVRVRHIETGEEKNVRLEAQRYRVEMIRDVLSGMLSRPILPVASKIYDWFMIVFRGTVVIYEDPEDEIYGMGAKDFIGISSSLFHSPQNGVALFHEIGEAAVAAGVVTIKDIENALRDRGWYEAHLAKPGRRNLKAHYALRALTREIFPQEDAELTRSIKGRSTGGAYEAFSTAEELDRAIQEREGAFQRAHEQRRRGLELETVEKERLAPPLAKLYVQKLRFLLGEADPNGPGFLEVVKTLRSVREFWRREHLSDDFLKQAGLEGAEGLLRERLAARGDVDALLEMAGLHLGFDSHPSVVEFSAYARDALKTGKALEGKGRWDLAREFYRRAYQTLHGASEEKRISVGVMDELAVPLARAAWRSIPVFLKDGAHTRALEALKDAQWVLSRSWKNVPEKRALQETLAQGIQMLEFDGKLALETETVRRSLLKRRIGDAVEQAHRLLSSVKTETLLSSGWLTMGDARVVPFDGWDRDETYLALLAQFQTIQKEAARLVVEGLGVANAIREVAREIRLETDALDRDSLELLLQEKEGDPKGRAVGELVRFVVEGSPSLSVRKLVFLRDTVLTGGKTQLVSDLFSLLQGSLTVEEWSDVRSLDALHLEWSQFGDDLERNAPAWKELTAEERTAAIEEAIPLAFRAQAAVEQTAQEEEPAFSSPSTGGGGTMVGQVARNETQRQLVVEELVELGAETLEAYLRNEREAEREVHRILLGRVFIHGGMRPRAARRIVREALRKAGQASEDLEGNLMGKFIVDGQVATALEGAVQDNKLVVRTPDGKLLASVPVRKASRGELENLNVLLKSLWQRLERSARTLSPAEYAFLNGSAAFLHQLIKQEQVYVLAPNSHNVHGFANERFTALSGRFLEDAAAVLHEAGEAFGATARGKSLAEAIRAKLRSEFGERALQFSVHTLLRGDGKRDREVWGEKSWPGLQELLFGKDQNGRLTKELADAKRERGPASTPRFIRDLARTARRLEERSREIERLTASGRLSEALDLGEQLINLERIEREATAWLLDRTAVELFENIQETQITAIRKLVDALADAQAVEAGLRALKGERGEFVGNLAPEFPDLDTRKLVDFLMGVHYAGSKNKGPASLQEIAMRLVFLNDVVRTQNRTYAIGKISFWLGDNTADERVKALGYEWFRFTSELEEYLPKFLAMSRDEQEVVLSEARALALRKLAKSVERRNTAQRARLRDRLASEVGVDGLRAFLNRDEAAQETIRQIFLEVTGIDVKARPWEYIEGVVDRILNEALQPPVPAELMRNPVEVAA